MIACCPQSCPRGPGIFSHSANEILNRPSVLGYIHAVAFGVSYPLLRSRSRHVVLCGSVGGFLNLRDTPNLETKVVKSRPLASRVDQGQTDVAVGKIDATVRTTVLFFHPKDGFIVFRKLFPLPVRHSDRDVSYLRSFHRFFLHFKNLCERILPVLFKPVLFDSLPRFYPPNSLRACSTSVSKLLHCYPVATTRITDQL